MEPVYRFGRFRLDPTLRRLTREGTPVELTARTLDLLLILVRNAGEVVTRDAIHEEVWPETVVSDNSVSVQISKLRSALGETARDWRYVETVARRGYRFSHSVRTEYARRNHPNTGEGSKAAPASSPTPDPQGIFGAFFLGVDRPNRRLFAAMFLLLVLGASAAGYFVWAGGERPPEPIRSIAVLPLENLSGDGGQEYFSDGMTEALISELARVEELQVISRTSAMRYKDTDKTIPQIARELGVDAVVEGGVLTAAGQVRINVQLIDGRSDRHLWAESYRRPLADVIRLQGQVALAVVEQLAAELELPEQLLPLGRESVQRTARRPTVDSTAYRLYLRGQHFRYQEKGESFLEAIRYLQEAIARDSSFAPAYAALTLPAGILPWYRSEIPSDLQPVDSLARWAARRAVLLDPSSAEAHLAMAIVHGHIDRNWTAAEQSYRNAIALNPGLAEVRREYAMMLLYTGRFEEALEEARTADRLDPLSPAVKQTLAAIAYCRRRYEEAIALARTSLELRPDQGVAVRWLGEAYLEVGKVRQALEELEKYAVEDSPWAWAKLGYAYGRAEKTRAARQVLERLRGMQAPSTMRALVFLGLGNNERALDLLEDGLAAPGRYDPYLKVHPMYDPLRQNPRYQRILEKMGLDQASVGRATEMLGERLG